MHIYTQIYEFASSAGAFEGYVYHRKSAEEIDLTALEIWTDHLLAAYGLLPGEALEEFQDNLDLTLSRAAASLEFILPGDHPVLEEFNKMIGRRIPLSPDDFQKKKWFE